MTLIAWACQYKTWHITTFLLGQHLVVLHKIWPSYTSHTNFSCSLRLPQTRALLIPKTRLLLYPSCRSNSKTSPKAKTWQFWICFRTNLRSNKPSSSKKTSSLNNCCFNRDSVSRIMISSPTLSRYSNLDHLSRKSSSLRSRCWSRLFWRINRINRIRDKPSNNSTSLSTRCILVSRAIRTS
jgi:hypothetical protein